MTLQPVEKLEIQIDWISSFLNFRIKLKYFSKNEERQSLPSLNFCIISLCIANFFKFMATNLSLTHFVTAVKPLY